MPLVKHPTPIVVTQFDVARLSWPCPFTGGTPVPRQIDPTAALAPQRLKANQADARQSQGPVTAKGTERIRDAHRLQGGRRGITNEQLSALRAENEERTHYVV